MRQIFASILAHCEPTNVLSLLSKFIDSLREDIEHGIEDNTKTEHDENLMKDFVENAVYLNFKNY